MAKNLQVQVAGGSTQAGKEANTVGELAKMVGAEGFTAVVNGEPADSSQELEDYQHVAFTKPVKAG